MTEKKRGRPKSTDRHKPRRVISIPADLADALEAIGRKNYTSLTQIAIRGLTEFVERQMQARPRDNQ